MIKTKPKKYYYSFLFNDNSDYIDVREDIIEADPVFMKAFEGSGIALFSNAFDLSFKCTPAVYKKLVAYIRRHHGDALISVDRS